MKILFLLGDYGKHSLERQFAEETQKLIGKDAEVTVYDPALPLPAPGELDGIWIFTHEEEGGCPEELMALIEANIGRFEDVPVVASGVGGKDGGMNAATEIAEYFDAHGGRFYTDSEPLCIPLRTTRFELEPDEKMDLFFVVDAFLKYCGMDDSESRKIAFGTVVKNYFRLMKYLSPDGAKPTELSIEGDTVHTDVGDFDCALTLDAPAEMQDLRIETDTLVSDYEIEEGEIVSALLEKILREW